jgi:hypothetical protein
MQQMQIQTQLTGHYHQTPVKAQQQSMEQEIVNRYIIPQVIIIMVQIVFLFYYPMV